MWKKIGRYTILSIGSLFLIGLMTWGGYTAVRSINGLAVAQSGTRWNNLKDGAFGDNATNGVGAFIPYLFDGTNFDRARGTTTNGIDVDVTRLNDGGNVISVDDAGATISVDDGGGSITVDGSLTGSSTPTDTFTNPTNAVLSWSLLSAWNGTTWDRIRLNTTQNDGLATTGSGAMSTLSFVYAFNGTTFDRIRGDITNGLDVDVTRLNDGGNSITVDDGGTSLTVDGSITAVGTTTPGFSFAKPTDALTSFSLSAGWNGSTWEPLFSGSSDSDSLGVNTAGVLRTTSLGYVWDSANSLWRRQAGGGNNGDNITADALGLSKILSSTTELGGTSWDRVRHSFNQGTGGITTNGVGTTVDMSNTPMSKFTMVVDRTAGATNVVEIDLECSVDGSVFVQIGTITDLTNEPVLTSVDGTPCLNIRYNVVTVGAGNTISVALLAMR